MTRLLVPVNLEDAVTWQPLDLPSDQPVVISATREGLLPSLKHSQDCQGVEIAVITPYRHSGRMKHALLTLPGTKGFVDAEPVEDMTTLRERNCLAFWVGEEEYRAFYDGSNQARVEPFGGDSTLECVFCCQPLLKDSPSVTCPGCGLVYHQSEELSCWTSIGEKCPRCGQTTSLENQPCWIPFGF